MYELRAKSTKEADILMYGGISEWGRVRAEDFIYKLSEAKNKGYEKVNLKINSPGGSIIEGIAITAQMLTKEVHITGTVEGMACSMMAIVLQKCHRRRMVKGTMLMVHQGAGAVYGSENMIRNYADLMGSMNKIIADILASTTKKKTDWILENWMAEGKDTWFTAEQALKEGLIDEIVDGNVKPLEKETANLLEMAAHYQQYCDTKENKMDRDELIKQFGLKADATDAEILAAIGKLKANQKTPETEDPTKKKEKDETVTAVAGDASAIIVLEQLATDRGMKKEQIESLKVLAKTDIKAAMALLPEKKAEAEAKTLSINDLIGAIKGGTAGGTVAEDRKGWNFDDWQKKDSAGLLKMANEKPEDYCKLFEAYHGMAISAEEVKALVKR